MQVAEVRVNGAPVAKHEGGYLPFSVDLTEALAKDGNAVVAVRVDNTHKPLIPPGAANNKIDFCYFGGIYRKARLRVTDPVHITDAVAAGKVAGGGVFARYENVSESSADILVSAQVKNESAAPANTGVRFVLRDAEGREVASADAAPERSRPAPIGASRRNSPSSRRNSGIRIPLTATRSSPKSSATARSSTKTRPASASARWRSTTADSGSTGNLSSCARANRHQDYPWLSNAVPDNAGRRDVRLLKEAGYNFLRLCHYPQSQAAMDACDELGVMAMVCTPGWQYFNNDEAFNNHARQNIREMVRWHRNHPSAVMWEISLNETYGHDDFYSECAKIAHEEYPGDQMLTSGDTYSSDSCGYLDIPYTVWIDGFSNMANPAARWKKAFAREYGDYNFGAAYSTSRVPLGAGEEALLLQAWNHQWQHNTNVASAWFGGDCLWAGIDDASGCVCPGRPVSWWGPLDYNRLPKFSYRFYESQRSPVVTPDGVASGPTVFIANYWTPRESPAKVVVFSNCDEVELFLNGKSLGRRKPDDGPDSKYGEWHPELDVVYMANGGDNARETKKAAAQVAAHAAMEKAKRARDKNMFDGGNCRHLDHAPFTFGRLDYAPGELRAVGYLAGKPVSEFTRRTPGKPASLRLEIAENGTPLAADGADAVFVRAFVLDATGTVIPDTKLAVTFTVGGAARVVGRTSAPTEAGIASALIASTGTPGAIRITAKTEGLPEARLDYAAKP